MGLHGDTSATQFDYRTEYDGIRMRPSGKSPPAKSRPPAAAPSPALMAKSKTNPPAKSRKQMY